MTYPGNLRPSEGQQPLHFNITITNAKVACTLHPGQEKQFDTAEEAQAAALHPYEWCDWCDITLDAEESRGKPS